MTRKQFIDMIATAESDNKPKTIGDGGMAGGLFQMHFAWRVDYWPAWAWNVLALLDESALQNFVTYDRDGKLRPSMTARQLADLFNTGHPAADPKYDERCLAALHYLDIDSEQFDSIVE